MQLNFSNIQELWYSWLIIKVSVLWMNIQGWFPLGLTGFLSLVSKGLLRVFSSTTIQKHQFFSTQPSSCSNSHIPYITTEKTIALTIWTFVGKMMSLLFNMLSRFVIAFLLRSKCLLISWLQSLSAVVLEPKKTKPISASFSPSICHEVMGPDAMILVFILSFKPAFSLFSFTLKRLFSSSSLSAIRVVSSTYHLHRAVIDISPRNLDSSLWVFKPSISHDV